MGVLKRVAAAASAACLAGTAAAQEGPAERPEASLPLSSSCAAKVAGEAKALPFGADDALTEAQRSGLSAGVFVALSDSTGARTWPEPQIAAAPPCPIARFDADSHTWTISAGTGEAPPRWIRAAGREDYFFVATGPRPEEATAWARSRPASLTLKHPPAYYLTAVASGTRFVFKVYDSQPDNGRLADDLAKVIVGSVAPLAAYDPAGEAVSLFLPTESGQTAELFRPQLIDGDRNATLYGADGRYFTAATGEALVMRGSNLPCAETYGAFRRDRVFVLDARDDSLDLACRLSADESWITVFATRIPDTKRDRQVFAERLKEAQAGGVARRLKAVPTGPREALQAGQQWVDREGAGQAIWFMRRGEYLIELRATFALDLQTEVLDVLAPVSQGKLPETRVSGDGPA